MNLKAQPLYKDFLIAPIDQDLNLLLQSLQSCLTCRAKTLGKENPQLSQHYQMAELLTFANMETKIIWGRQDNQVSTSQGCIKFYCFKSQEFSHWVLTTPYFNFTQKRQISQCRRRVIILNRFIILTNIQTGNSQDTLILFKSGISNQHQPSAFSFLFLAMPTAYESSQQRDQTQATAATQTTAVTMPDP